MTPLVILTPGARIVCANELVRYRQHGSKQVMKIPSQIMVSVLLFQLILAPIGLSKAQAYSVQESEPFEKPVLKIDRKPVRNRAERSLRTGTDRSGTPEKTPKVTIMVESLKRLIADLENKAWEFYNSEKTQIHGNDLLEQIPDFTLSVPESKHLTERLEILVRFEQDGLRNPPLSRGGEQTYEVDTSLPGRISQLQSGVLQNSGTNRKSGEIILETAGIRKKFSTRISRQTFISFMREMESEILGANPHWARSKASENASLELESEVGVSLTMAATIGIGIINLITPPATSTSIGQDDESDWKSSILEGSGAVITAVYAVGVAFIARHVMNTEAARLIADLDRLPSTR